MARWYDRWYKELLGPDRQYFLFDSFQGLPTVKEIDGPHAAAWQADVNNPGTLTTRLRQLMRCYPLKFDTSVKLSDLQRLVRGYDAHVCSSLRSLY